MPYGICCRKKRKAVLSAEDKEIENNIATNTADYQVVEPNDDSQDQETDVYDLVEDDPKRQADVANLIQGGKDTINLKDPEDVVMVDNEAYEPFVVVRPKTWNVDNDVYDHHAAKKGTTPSSEREKEEKDISSESKSKTYTLPAHVTGLQAAYGQHAMSAALRGRQLLQRRCTDPEDQPAQKKRVSFAGRSSSNPLPERTTKREQGDASDNESTTGQEHPVSNGQQSSSDDDDSGTFETNHLPRAEETGPSNKVEQMVVDNQQSLCSIQENEIGTFVEIEQTIEDNPLFNGDDGTTDEAEHGSSVENGEDTDVAIDIQIPASNGTHKRELRVQNHRYENVVPTQLGALVGSFTIFTASSFMKTEEAVVFNEQVNNSEVRYQPIIARTREVRRFSL